MNTIPFEITSVKGLSKAKATKLIAENYPDNLTYNGTEFFDTVYYSSIL